MQSCLRASANVCPSFVHFRLLRPSCSLLHDGILLLGRFIQETLCVRWQVSTLGHKKRMQTRVTDAAVAATPWHSCGGGEMNPGPPAHGRQRQQTQRSRSRSRSPVLLQGPADPEDDVHMSPEAAHVDRVENNAGMTEEERQAIVAVANAVPTDMIWDTLMSELRSMSNTRRALRLYVLMLRYDRMLRHPQRHGFGE
jgi:hypothetical protein